MTAKEQADLAWDVIDTSIRKGHGTDLPAVILAAIEAAILEERNACAEIARLQAFSHAHRGFEGPELNSAAIANAIRRRGESK